MKLSEAIEKRRSIRKYSDKKVKFGDILEAIDAALQAPFAGNMDNLKFIIVENQETKDRIAECCQQDFVAEASAVVVVVSDLAHINKLYEREDAYNYSKHHTGAAIENFLLRITELKLASCWVGAFDEFHIKSALLIPEGLNVEAILPVGHPHPTLKLKKPRKNSLENSIYWEKWGISKKPTFFKDPRTW